MHVMKSPIRQHVLAAHKLRLERLVAAKHGLEMLDDAAARHHCGVTGHMYRRGDRCYHIHATYCPNDSDQWCTVVATLRVLVERPAGFNDVASYELMDGQGRYGIRDVHRRDGIWCEGDALAPA